MSKTRDIQIKNTITTIGLVIFLILGIKYAVAHRLDLLMDIALSIIILAIFHKFYNRLHQDYKSYFFVIFAWILHDLFLYSHGLFGLKFERYMHFTAGFAIAIFADRLFYEKLSKAKRFLLLIIFALGIGVIGEFVEYFGYTTLGLGEGLFRYGIGDEGEWGNAILDLVSNVTGALVMAVLMLFRKNNKLKK